jgi:hypothetical protein
LSFQGVLLAILPHFIFSFSVIRQLLASPDPAISDRTISKKRTDFNKKAPNGAIPVLSGASMGFNGEEKGAVCGAERPFQDKLDVKKPPSFYK